MSMEDLLAALLRSGMQQQQQAQRNPTDPTAQLLQALLGGGQQPQQPMSGNLDSLLEAFGGGQQPARPTQSAPAGGLESLIGSLMGMGGPTAQPGGMNLAQNPLLLQMLLPLITPLAQKLNISPQVAMMIVTFVLQALMANRGKKTTAATTQGLNLDGLLRQASSPQGITPAYVQSTGMVRELSKQTGLDDATASRGLLEVLSLLGQQATQAGLRPAATGTTAVKKAPAKPAAGKTTGKSSNPKKGGKARK